MKSPIWCVLVVNLFGCSSPTSDPPAANPPTSGVARSLPNVSSPAPARAETVAPEGGAAGECKAIAATLSALPGAVVTRSDGIFDDPVRGRDRTGCVVTVKGSFGALPGTQRPELTLAQALQGRGLTADHQYDADGPDGTRFVFRTDEIWCIVQGRWDGGDDSDPTYVPADWYEVSAGCTAEPAREKP